MTSVRCTSAKVRETIWSQGVPAAESQKRRLNAELINGAVKFNFFGRGDEVF
jgi:hypothetical protein